VKSGGDASKRDARIFAGGDRKGATAFAARHLIANACHSFTADQRDGRAWSDRAAVARAVAFGDKRKHDYLNKMLGQ